MDSLVEYGWTDAFSRHVADSDALDPARVTVENSSTYRVRTGQGERSARLSGRLRHETIDTADRPAVGDWVAIESPAEEGDVTIHRVLPRKSRFSRKAAGHRTDEQVVAANVDTVWIVTSLDQDFSLRRIERYLALAWESGAVPAVILTKADLCDQADRLCDEVQSVARGVGVHRTSSLTQEGLQELHRYFQDHATVALLGSSGVGKSTLINVLAGESLQQTGDVRSDGKGRHTTTQRQLIRLPGGGLIIDTPGMRELQLWDSESGLSETFCEIEQLSRGCRFSDCTHTSEPGCAVLDAVATGQLAEERLLSHQKLQRELAHLERKQDARARAEQKRRTKVIMKTLRHHPKYNR